MQGTRVLIHLKSGISQIMKNEVPIYEIISGATLSFCCGTLLILPGFATDVIGYFINISIYKKNIS